MIKKAKSLVDSIFKTDSADALGRAIGLDEEIAKFCASLPDKIREEALSDDGTRNFQLMVNEITAELLNSKCADIFRISDTAALQQHCQRVYTVVFDDQTKEKIGQEVRNILENSLKCSLSENAKKLHSPLDQQKLSDSICSYISNSLRSEQTREMVRSKIEELVANLKSRKIGKLKKWLDPEIRNQASLVIGDFLIETMSMRFKEFSEQAELWDIITTSLNSYDNRQIEKLVRSVANRELFWLTLLGGIIGLIFGVTQGIMNIWWLAK